MTTPRLRAVGAIVTAVVLLGGALAAWRMSADPTPDPIRPLADADPPETFPGSTREVLPDADGAPTLARADAARATAVARTAERVRALLDGTRHRVLMVRPDEEGCPSCVHVTYYVYTRDVVVNVVVDRATWAIARVEQGRGQPPLSLAEQRRAHALAEAAPGVRALIGDDPHAHPGLARPMWPRGGICDIHRCASVTFMFDGLAATGVGRQVHALVDLSADRVLDHIAQWCDPECVLGWEDAR